MTGLAVSTPATGVLDVTLDCGADSVLTMEQCAEFARLLTRPPADAHVLRISSTGSAFCLGRERGGTTPGEVRAEATTLVGLHRALRDTRLVTVAQVHGDAAGFGVGMVAACDVAVAESRACFSFPEVGINLAPALVLAWLPKAIGEREAFWLTATGERITAARALQLGLLNAVVEGHDQLVKSVDARVDALRAHNPRVHAEIRQMLRDTRGLDEDQALELSIDRLVVGSLRVQEDFQVGE